MKNIWLVFKNDIKNIAKSPFAVLVLIGLIVIPSLYAWVNIYACWDPYGNTKNISVAVSNQDNGIKLKGVPVNIGGMIVDNLAKNEDIGWEFMSADEAKANVESGKTYAAIVIPSDFSEDMLSVLTTDLKRPQINYIVNEKKNAVAPKITNAGIDAIQKQINETFIRTISDIWGSLLVSEDDKAQNTFSDALNHTIDRLQQSSGSLQTFSETANSFALTTSAINAMLSTIRSSTFDQSLRQAADTAADAQNAVTSIQMLTDNLNATISTLLKTVSNDSVAIETMVDVALDQVETQANQAANQLDAAQGACTSLQELNTRLIDVLQTLQAQFSSLSDIIQPIIDSVSNANNQLSQLKTQLSKGAQSLRETGTISVDLKNSIAVKTKEVHQGLFAMSEQFERNVSAPLKQLCSNFFSGLNNFESLLNSISGVNWNSFFYQMQSGLRDVSDSLFSIKDVFADAKTKVDEMIVTLKQGTQSEQLQQLQTLIQRNPAIISAFLAAPVEVQTENVYSIANYGSAMTPFYTVLCLWVGSIILAALLKVNIKNQKKLKLTHNQSYWGRLILFLLICVCQALFVCFGDLYLLHVQCLNPGLFLFAGVYTSIVFTLFVYTLVVSFGNVGKAIAVIFLVVQVAGAGGTYPIDVMPSVFKALNPFMPFTYAINAMRETVGGMYGMDYWWDLLRLSIWIPVALLLGLVLRKPLIELNHFMEQRLKDTDIM